MLRELFFGESDSGPDSETAQTDPETRKESDGDSKNQKSHSSPTENLQRERRASRRTPTRCLAQIHWADRQNPIFGRLEDVSETGCRLLTETSLEPGQSVTIELTVLGRTPRITIEATGTVKYVDDETDRCAYGVEFDNLTPSTQRAVDWLYNRERTLQPLNSRPSGNVHEA